MGRGSVVANAWTAEQARKELDAWRSSGLSIDRFAKERRIGAHRLRYWKQRFEHEAAQANGKALSLLPVRVVHRFHRRHPWIHLRSAEIRRSRPNMRGSRSSTAGACTWMTTHGRVNALFAQNR
jgi:hypothetical protein